MQQGRGRVYGKEDTTSQSAVRWVWKDGEREETVKEKERERVGPGKMT